MSATPTVSDLRHDPLSGSIPNEDLLEAASRTSNLTLLLLLVSVLGLFLEMMLIRWISTEVRIFAYLQNTVLVVCFLGLGMGCFTCRQPISSRGLLLPLLVLVTILAIPVTRESVGKIGNWLSLIDDLPIWYGEASRGLYESGAKVVVGLLLAFTLMVLLWEIFLPIGRILGRLLNDHPRPIWAYSVNVGGSLLGIWLFALMSAFYLPPGLWGLMTALLLLPFLGQGRERIVNLGLLAAIVAGCWAAGLDSTAKAVVWSPYQKLALVAVDDSHPDFPGKYLINVNNVGYQGMIDLSQEGVAKNPRIKPSERGLGQYDVPMRFKPEAENVLIVGAGAGNDAAGALRGKAKKVTAVEIDPAILAMGREHHPERPYDDSRVRAVVDDARSFFATTGEKYDLVIFGLLDSHTTTAMTNARLDHYVYTRESLQRVKSLLTEDAVVVLSFQARRAYILDRMAGVLKEVFGHEPLCFRVPEPPESYAGYGGWMFVTGNRRAISHALSSDSRLDAQVKDWQRSPAPISYTTPVTTDDWPYVYLASPRIPTLYLILGVLLLALLGYARFSLKAAPLGIAGWTRSHWHFFFLGAAFMLLEVQNVSKASVVLGSTWQVNAVIVSGVLCMILLSNLVVSVWPGVPQGLVGTGLIASCLALYFFDLSQLAFLPPVPRALLVGTLTTLPMLFSGILFMDSFGNAERKDLALGANLLGALAGGLLQSVTFVTGVKALLLIVAALYLVALLTRPQVKVEREPQLAA
jgi:spermidine synthase